MASKNKKNSLNLDKKIKICDKYKKGEEIKTIAEEFKVSQNTVKRIGALSEQDINKIKTLNPKHTSIVNKCKFKDIDEYMLNYVKDCNSMSFPISGKIIKEVAKRYAQAKNITSFTASNGWLYKFQQRYSIKSKVICGESKDANVSEAEEFSKNIVNEISEYQPCDIFNFDETGLLYLMLPNKSLMCKGYKHEGLKKEKKRLTLLFGVSQTGEKAPILVIGKSKNPRAFRGKDLSWFNIKYESNKASWITKDIFQSYFKNFNDHMISQNRKIIVIIDNCTAHKIENLSNIVFKFLPPNTTSLIQPLDQGIIYSFKLLYRDAFLNAIYHKEAAELKKNIKSFNLFKVIESIHYAWNGVKISTIVNCFTKLYDFGNSNLVENDNTNEIKSIYNISNLIIGETTKKEDLNNFIEFDTKEVMSTMAGDAFFTDRISELNDQIEIKDGTTIRKKKIRVYEETKEEVIQLKKKMYPINPRVASALHEIELYLNREIVNENNEK